MFRSAKCPDCGKNLLKHDKPKSWSGASKYVYLCEDWPNCKGLCSADSIGNIQGVPADAKTRKARKATHELLDPFWKLGLIGRSGIYVELAKAMGLSNEACHVSRFSLQQCTQAQSILAKWKKEWFMPKTHTCDGCNREFVPEHPKDRYCGDCPECTTCGRTLIWSMSFECGNKLFCNAECAVAFIFKYLFDEGGMDAAVRAIAKKIKYLDTPF